MGKNNECQHEYRLKRSYQRFWEDPHLHGGDKLEVYYCVKCLVEKEIIRGYFKCMPPQLELHGSGQIDG